MTFSRAASARPKSTFPVKRISANTRKKARKIKLLLLDVDGVLTDGAIVMNDKGEEIKFFDVRDGHGIRLLMHAGLQVGLITGRFSKVVNHRAKDLGIRLVYQMAFSKIDAYQKIQKRTGLKDEEIAYMGDDIVDLPVLSRVGLAVAVRDCWKELKRRADYVTAARGGHGAVREVVELLLSAQRKWTRVTRQYYRY
jgi:3-deoxy-D-manno-octulosonate 8-phosphate phosphatase (KDO 8-P phosphatase)